MFLERYFKFLDYKAKSNTKFSSPSQPHFIIRKTSTIHLSFFPGISMIFLFLCNRDYYLSDLHPEQSEWSAPGTLHQGRSERSAPGTILTICTRNDLNDLHPGRSVRSAPKWSEDLHLGQSEQSSSKTKQLICTRDILNDLPGTIWTLCGGNLEVKYREVIF